MLIIVWPWTFVHTDLEVNIENRKGVRIRFKIVILVLAFSQISSPPLAMHSSVTPPRGKCPPNPHPWVKVFQTLSPGLGPPCMLLNTYIPNPHPWLSPNPTRTTIRPWHHQSGPAPNTSSPPVTQVDPHPTHPPGGPTPTPSPLNNSPGCAWRPRTMVRIRHRSPTPRPRGWRSSWAAPRSRSWCRSRRPVRRSRASRRDGTNATHRLPRCDREPPARRKQHNRYKEPEKSCIFFRNTHMWPRDTWKHKWRVGFCKEPEKLHVFLRNTVTGTLFRVPVTANHL